MLTVLVCWMVWNGALLWPADMCVCVKILILGIPGGFCGLEGQNECVCMYCNSLGTEAIREAKNKHYAYSWPPWWLLCLGLFLVSLMASVPGETVVYYPLVGTPNGFYDNFLKYAAIVVQ